MADPIQVQYVGFSVQGKLRQYWLRGRRAQDEFHDFCLSIPNAAFLAGRVRYQDAAEICSLKLHHELTASEQLPKRSLMVTDEDLAQYRAAHTPKPPQRRLKVPARP